MKDQVLVTPSGLQSDHLAYPYFSKKKKKISISWAHTINTLHISKISKLNRKVTYIYVMGHGQLRAST